MIPNKLREQILLVEGDLPDLTKSVSDDAVAQHLIARLRVATDNAAGCVVLAERTLGPPLVTVARSIFESFLVSYWATLSDTNGEAVLNISKNEGLRLLRNLLRNERGIIQRKVTGEDYTHELLRSPEFAEIRATRRFDKIADEAGLKKLYDLFYGILSMFAHGNATDLIPRMPDELITSHIAAVASFLKVMHSVVSNYVREHRVTTHDEIGRILKVALP